MVNQLCELVIFQCHKEMVRLVSYFSVIVRVL